MTWVAWSEKFSDRGHGAARRNGDTGVVVVFGGRRRGMVFVVLLVED